MEPSNYDTINCPNPSSALLQSASHSQSRILKLFHTWTIDHFSYHIDPELNDHIYLESSKFSPFKFNQDKLRFFLRLYPRGLDSENNKSHVSVYLHLDSSRYKVNLKIKLAILDDQESCCKTKENVKKICENGFWGWANFISHTDLKNSSNLLPEDKLAIYCEIDIIERSTSKSCDPKLLDNFTSNNLANFIETKSSNISSTSWTHTKQTVDKLCHIWTIDNFSFRCLDQKNEHSSVNSEAFSTNSSDRIKRFYLSLFPKGQCQENRNYVSLFLFNVGEVKNVKTSFKLSIVNSAGKKCHTKEYNIKFTQQNGYGLHQYIQRTKLLNPENKLLPNDKLTIYCEINIIGDMETTSSTSILQEQNRSKLCSLAKEQLTLDFGSIFLDEPNRFCDVTLVAKGKEFRAHKVILASRSPVFAKMFEHQLKESRNNRVDIVDIEHEVLEKLLKFIYSADVDLLGNEIDEKLLIAADKYQLESLKKLCEDSLGLKMSTRNVFDLLVLADMHSSIGLKAKAIEFVKSEASNLAKEDFRDFHKCHPELFFKVFWDIIDNKQTESLTKLTLFDDCDNFDIKL